MTDQTELAGYLPGTVRHRRARPLSAFEFWPGGVFYAPIVLQWALLGLRYGNPFVTTAANPLIESGGLCGESKSSILDMVGAAARASIAPYVTIRVTGDPAIDAAAAAAAMQTAGLTFPLVAKPDLGCNGAGVKVMADAAALAAYCRAFPQGELVVLQQLIDMEGEAGIFYIRAPGRARGRVSSLTLKFSPYVTGDGEATLGTLIRRDERAGRLQRLYLPRFADRLNEVPAPGERVRLVFTGNHCKGSIFRNGNALVTEAMTERFDAIAKSMPEFHFGRFDVRYDSLEALRQGEGFSIIEINGVGSEATHIWDRETSLVEAYRSQLEHYAAAFEIGAANRRRGFRPTSALTLARLWHRQRQLIARYPLSD